MLNPHTKLDIDWEWFNDRLDRQDGCERITSPHLALKQQIADGEIYYCNWPQIVSKNGNRKMFLETKWKHPYEQTWMSHIYKLTASNHLRSAILLLSPTTHNRFEHYDASDRKEN